MSVRAFLAVLLACGVGCGPEALDEPITNAEDDGTISASVVAGNLVVNGSFEVNTLGWSGWNSRLSRLAYAGAPQGAFVGKISYVAGTSFSIDDSVATVSTPLAGRTYRGEAAARAGSPSSVGKPLSLTLREKTKQGVVVKTWNSQISLTNSFVRLAVTAAPTSSQNTLEIFALQAAPTAGDAFLIDDLAVRLVPVATPVDANATAETRALFSNLQAVSDAAVPNGPVLFGMDAALTSGFFTLNSAGKIDSKLPDGFKSDVRTITGKGPAIISMDLASIVGDWWSPTLPSRPQGPGGRPFDYYQAH